MAPLPTKAVTSATVYTIGDILSQNKEGRDMGELDRGRILRSLLAGLIGHGPMSHVWYHVSEDFFDGVLVGHHWWDFIPKVVVDQVCRKFVLALLMYRLYCIQYY
jgi:protein Mpv17